jgi:hypothetical protein
MQIIMIVWCDNEEAAFQSVLRKSPPRDDIWDKTYKWAHAMTSGKTILENVNYKRLQVGETY